ncbi:MAG TPA: SUF system NifU family Fe-S cluster assembly protein [Firmicutes bacterium]|nr:SUF system NifU family Fe-S cluster assembly protein [Bacillota bacterium]
MDLSSLYTELILEHSRNCENKRSLECATCKKRGYNPSCGDDITIELLIEDGEILDAAFLGEGCAISQASTSMMIDLIKGRSAKEAQKLVNLFLGMIKREINDEETLEVLEEAIALKNISNMPARVKCAVLAWHTLSAAINETKPPESTN